MHNVRVQSKQVSSPSDLDKYPSDELISTEQASLRAAILDYGLQLIFPTHCFNIVCDTFCQQLQDKHSFTKMSRDNDTEMPQHAVIYEP